MGMSKLHNLVPSITNFGLAPREGYKLCIKCRYTIPEAAFYKCDLDDPTALCKKHKEHERKLSRLQKVDTPVEQAVLRTAPSPELDTATVVEEETD